MNCRKSRKIFARATPEGEGEADFGSRILKFLLITAVYGVFLLVVARTVMKEDRHAGSEEPGDRGHPASLVVETPPVAEVVPTVVIDAGHGGKDGGTVQNGMIEKDGVLAISLMLRDELERRGIPVVMTREDDITLELLERSSIANQQPRMLLVSIHLNSGPASVKGIETFYSMPKSLEAQRVSRREFHARPGDILRDERGEGLALLIQNEVCSTTGARNRGVKNRPSLSVTRHTFCPAVLVECGFLTHPEESKSIKTRAYQAQLARGIANGVEAYIDTVEATPEFGVVWEKRGVPDDVDVVSAER